VFDTKRSVRLLAIPIQNHVGGRVILKAMLKIFGLLLLIGGVINAIYTVNTTQNAYPPPRTSAEVPPSQVSVPIYPSVVTYRQKLLEQGLLISLTLVILGFILFLYARRLETHRPRATGILLNFYVVVNHLIVIRVW